MRNLTQIEKDGSSCAGRFAGQPDHAQKFGGYSGGTLPAETQSAAAPLNVDVQSIKKDIIRWVKQRRKAQKISQQMLAKRSGVSFGSIKRFERFGEIALSALLHIVAALGGAADFADLFQENIFLALEKNLPSPLDAAPPERLAVFRSKKVRRVFYNNEWWFCLLDVVTELLHSPQPYYYLRDMRRRDHSLSRLWPTLTKLLLLDTPHGKQKLSCINTLGLFRVIQSMPNLPAEPWRLWLAQAAYERIRYIEDPMLAVRLAQELYKAKGYTDNWIAKKISGALVEDPAVSTKGQTEQEYRLFMAEIAKMVSPTWQ